jgi:hypothetical protein|tara:strand:- start:1033 stop:1197 length:165 start_codon:yes stop_codon:yes gene_type:complete
MGPKRTVKEDVETVLLLLHAKIDFLRAKIEAMCDSTHECTAKHYLKKESKKDKK